MAEMFTFSRSKKLSRLGYFVLEIILCGRQPSSSVFIKWANPDYWILWWFCRRCLI